MISDSRNAMNGSRRAAAIDERDRGTDGTDKTALVTGASSGIGRSMAELLAAKGFAVILVARRRERLVAISEDLAQRWGVEAQPLVADLASADAPAQIVAALEASGHSVDLLVNNAGYSRIGRYDTFDWADHERRLRVMGVATLELTHRLLAGMVERQWGRIVNVASIAGLFSATPQDAVYGATKAMVQRFSESIDAEFRECGVRCTVSIPGFTETEIFQTSGFADHVARNPLYRAALMSPATVARQAYAAVMSGHPMVIHGRHHRALALVLLHAPLPLRRGLSNALAGRIEADR
jgi:short-subunit dehydrogenase